MSYTTEFAVVMHIPLIRFSWEALALVWLFGVLHTKPTLRTADLRLRIASIATLLLGFFLIVSDWAPSWLVMRGPLLGDPALQVTGETLTLVGCAFAIWARLALGGNWSGRPTIKAGHELVVSGPYKLARHPIYTGLLAAVIGTTLADLQWRRVIGAAMITVALLLKMRQEERLMIEAFPDLYPQYQRRVRALIPGMF